MRDFASMHSGSSVLCSVEGHAPCHFFASAHTCPVASSRGWTTQTCAPEDGLPEHGSKQPHTLSNSAYISPKFGGLHAISARCGFVRLIDHVRAHIESTHAAYATLTPLPAAAPATVTYRSVHRPRTARSSRYCMTRRCRHRSRHRQHPRRPSSYCQPLNPYPCWRRMWTTAAPCSGRYSAPSDVCCCSTLPPYATTSGARRGR